MELPSVLTPQQQRKKKNNSSMAQTLAMPIAPSLALISNPRPLSRAVYFPVLNPPKVRELSIECAQVGGVEIPNNKRIEFSLQYIHGIGRSRARKILCDISMDNKVTKDLSEEDLITLRDEVSKYVIEGDLQQRKKKNNSSMAQTLAMPIAPSLALISNPRPLSRAVYFPVLNPPKVRELSIECARVGGVEIPNNKRIEFSLQYIHGIGRSRARKILCDISMDNKVTKDLSEEDLITLRDEVSKYVIEGDLRRFNALNIRRLNYDNVKLYMYKRAIEEVVGFGSQIAKQFYLTWKCGQKIFKKVKPLIRGLPFQSRTRHNGFRRGLRNASGHCSEGSLAAKNSNMLSVSLQPFTASIHSVLREISQSSIDKIARFKEKPKLKGGKQS
ncbi:uncharacterized protein LOC107620785 [Arachis ipaensis]|uniref:uncharacterized protein LOC107620785 n=1 Tax=Arachis ipaensis TaxID=130454 RepID=UPI000A2B10DC|nr:uncharacterized protein LOC107620785 [Arachis ipaensis]